MQPSSMMFARDKDRTEPRNQELVRPKDAVDPTKHDGVVYRIPYEYGKVYIADCDDVWNLHLDHVI